MALQHLPQIVFHVRRNHGPTCCTFGKVKDEEVSKLINSMTAKSSPLDILPIKLLKSCSAVFSHVMTQTLISSVGDQLTEASSQCFWERKRLERYCGVEVVRILKVSVASLYILWRIGNQWSITRRGAAEVRASDLVTTRTSVFCTL